MRNNHCHSVTAQLQLINYYYYYYYYHHHHHYYHGVNKCGCRIYNPHTDATVALAQCVYELADDDA